MTFSSSRLLLPWLALILLCLLLNAEARRFVDESNASEARHHRHRHRHEIASQRWPVTATRKRANDELDDYEESYPSELDYEEYADEDEESIEADYGQERRGAASRSHAPKRPAGNRHRYEERYPAARYHHRASHQAGTGRGYEARGQRRTGSRSGYRKRYKDEESAEEAEGYERSVGRRRYDDDYDGEDDEPSYRYKHKGGSRKRITSHSSDLGEAKGRRSRYEPRKDWRYKVDDEEDDYAYDADDESGEDEEEENARDGRARKYARKGRMYPEKSKSDNDRDKSGWRSTGNKFDEWMKKTRQPINGSRFYDGSSKRRNSRPAVQEDDQEDELRDEEEEEVELWKDEEEDKELDNDFYKNDEETNPPLKTYDDIIRRLTEDRTTTTSPRTTTQVKRDYRNTDLESHLRRDAYGNLRFFEPKRNLSTSSRYRSGVGSISRNSNLVDGTTEGRKDLALAATGKSLVARKKSLEVDEEDKAKGAEEEEESQADANTVSLSLCLVRPGRGRS